MKIVVVGGGVSGLAAAWRARELRPDAEILLLEASDRVGGKLRTGEVAGISVDLGAESMLARNPLGTGLLSAVGLGAELHAPVSLGAGIRAGGARHPLPAGTLMGIPADLDAVRASGILTPAMFGRVVEEAHGESMRPLVDDISVGELVRTRLGEEVVERLVEPLLGGVYAGRADQISVMAALPALAARLREPGGSLIETAARAVQDGRSGSYVGPVFVSLPGGLGRFAGAFATTGAFDIRTSVTVRAVDRAPEGFVIRCGPTTEVETIRADRIVLATPAAKSAVLLRSLAPVAARELAGVEAASVAIITLAFDAARLAAGVGLPAGSGLLVAPGEGFFVKAATFSSQKWPGTPAGTVLLRASLGRIGENAVLQRDDRELVDLVRSDLTRLIGLTSAPIDSHVMRWGGALPQYEVGHVARVQRIRDDVAHVPGLAICGALFDGVGIPACIGAAYRAVEQLGLQAMDQGE